MTDLTTLVSILLGNFATVRFRKCEQLWTWPVADQPLTLHGKLLEIATRGQSLILGCHRQYLRQRLLDGGYRCFFDRLEGDGPDGWRLHFFCFDPSAVTALHDAGLGDFGPGDPASFNAREFVMMRLRQLERCGHLSKPHDWWWWFD